ncbi:alpha/beta hydrolase fold domain-containing protein [Mycobacterium sp. UNC410CL29Cvi84]|uniref:alpha/beta hydrolase n=1 Tax=Mycobacterium sp. UNC410CL29Cvi84 TaxID=1449059 RepID=UPI0018CC2821|nr:alpha/beta hydrolase fold domain-containing protein [Mycobacterium sp. UNC410CL29Cvi84]
MRLLQDNSSVPTGYRLTVLRCFADVVGLLDNRFQTSAELDVVDGVLRGRWVIGAGASIQQGVVLYLHGGGFVFGSSRSHLALAQRLSEASGLAVFLLDYRLAPEHPFPAAADDAIAAYRCLLDRGFEPSRVALAADSAGGHLLCSVLNDATRDNLPMPAAAVLFSPCLDLTGSGAAQRDAVRRDPVISPVLGAKMIRSYVHGATMEHSRLAVLSADMRRWPPVLIQVGDTECLLTDSERLAESLARAAVPSLLQVWPDQVHVFQALARVSLDARDALREAGWFLASNIGRQNTVERVGT